MNISLRSALLTLVMALSTGLTAHAAPNSQIDISAEKLEVNQTASKATFSGNVVVTQEGMTLTAPLVTADYKNQNSTSGIQTVTASGGVTITRAGSNGVSEKATGTTATYNLDAGTLVLTGDVTLTRGPSQLSGDKLVYNLQTGNAVVTNSSGPVKARFVPNK